MRRFMGLPKKQKVAATTSPSDVFDIIEIASPQTQASTAEVQNEGSSGTTGQASLSATTYDETTFKALLEKQEEIAAQLEAFKKFF